MCLGERGSTQGDCGRTALLDRLLTRTSSVHTGSRQPGILSRVPATYFLKFQCPATKSDGAHEGERPLHAASFRPSFRCAVFNERSPKFLQGLSPTRPARKVPSFALPGRFGVAQLRRPQGEPFRPHRSTSPICLYSILASQHFAVPDVCISCLPHPLTIGP